MTSAVGGVSISGSQLLGGMAGKIDTDALIDALMAAKSIPQNQLKDRLTAQKTLGDNLQEMSRRMQGVTTASLSLTDLAFDGVPTKATSSLTSVVASSSTGAIAGSASFHVQQVAAAQVSTVAVDGSGNVLDFASTQSLTLNVGGKDHTIALTSGSAADVAAAINKSDAGVRAAVITVNAGDPNDPSATKTLLQLSSKSTGLASAFGATGFSGTVSTAVDAKDAQIAVGNPASGGYIIASSTNTFTNAMPGVTFTVSSAAVDSDVTISVGDDVSALSDKVKSLVDAITDAKSGIKTLTAKGGLFQGDSTMNGIGFDLASAISAGTVGGKSLTDYGIDMDKDGNVTFDASVFTAAYNSDPEGTLEAIGNGGFATTMREIGEAASLPVIGSLAIAINADQTKTDDLNTQISKWDDRLTKEHDALVLKYTAMQTALAKLQSQGDWLTNMFKSITDSQKDN